MAKRNRVTVDLKINADAQLKNSRSFMNQLDKWVDKFDFGSKIEGQFTRAKKELNDLNKVLTKIQGKSFISDDELSNAEKSVKEIAKIISKNEGLFGSFSTKDLQKMSRERIAEEKRVQEQIAKIKQEYSNKTGRSYDQDAKDLEKINTKIAQLGKTIKNLNNSRQTKIDNEIKKQNDYYQSQLDTLSDIKKVQKDLENGRANIANKFLGQGYTRQQLNSKVNTDKSVITKDVANAAYNQMAKQYDIIAKKSKEILQNEKDEQAQVRALNSLLKTNGQAAVKTTEEFKEQLKLKKEEVNYYRLLRNRNELATEKAITEETERRTQLLKAQEQYKKEIAKSDTNVIRNSQFNSLADMRRQSEKAQANLNTPNITISGDTVQLNDSGTQEIVNAINSSIDKEINSSRQEFDELQGISQQFVTTNQQIATATEQQKNDGITEKELSQELNADGKRTIQEVNEHTSIDNSENTKLILTNEKLKKVKKSSPDYQAINKGISTLTDPEKYDAETLEANKNLFAKSFDNIFNSINDAIMGEGSLKEIKEKTLFFESLIDELIDEMSQELNSREQMRDAEVAAIKNNNTFSPSQAKQLIDDAYKSFGEDQISFKNTQDALNNLKGNLKPIHQIVDGSKKAEQSVNKLSESAYNTSMNFGRAAQESRYFGDAIDSIVNKAKYLASLPFLLDTISRKGREAINMTLDMDKDMTQIGLVLETTASNAWKSFNTYSQMADRLSTTTSEVTTAMKLFYQQGLNTVETNKMVEASAIAAALGETSMAEASETLTSIVNSYQLSANDALDVTDKISQVAIVSAADFDEMSVAIEKVASSAASAGLDLDHLMGYLGKVIETTREAPTNVGTALKTIVANFEQFKEAPEKIAEEGSEINKVDTALKSVGISLTDTNGEVRDLGDVLDELGGQWENLGRSEKAYLATQIAGTRQQSRFFAMMNDYDRTLELVNESANSSGKATQQFALYQDSLTAATKRAENEVQKFYHNLTKGDGVLKSVVKGFTGLIGLANKLGPIGTGLAIIAGQKGLGLVSNTLNRVREQLNDILQKASSLPTLTSKMKLNETTATGVLKTEDYGIGPLKHGLQNRGSKIGIGIAGALTGVDKKVANYQELNGILEKYNSLSGETAEIEEQANKLYDSSNQQLTYRGQKITEISAAQGEFNATLESGTKINMKDVVTTEADAAGHAVATTVKWGEVAAQLALNIAIGAAIALVGLAVKAVYDWITAEHKDAQAKQEEANAATEEADKISRLGNAYLKLSKQVNLTENDLSDLADARKELLDQFPELIAGYDEEGNAIAKTNEEIEKLIANKEKEAATKVQGAAVATNQDSGSYLNPYSNKSFIQGASAVKKEDILGENNQAMAESLQANLESMRGSWLEQWGVELTRYFGRFGGAMAVDFYENGTQQGSFRKKMANVSEKLSAGLFDEAYEIVNSLQDSEIPQDLKHSVETLKGQIKSSQKAVYEASASQLSSTYAELVQSADLDDTQSLLLNNMLSTNIGKQIENKSDEEIKEWIGSGEGKDFIQQYLNAISNTDNVDQYMKFVDLSKDTNISYSQLLATYNQLPDAYQTLANNTKEAIENTYSMAAKILAGYGGIEDNALTDQQKEEIAKMQQTLGNYSKTALGNIVDAFNSYGDTEEGQQKRTNMTSLFSNLQKQQGTITGTTAFDDFITEYNDLDRENMIAIEAFKNKWLNVFKDAGVEIEDLNGLLDDIINKTKKTKDEIATQFATAQNQMVKDGTSKNGYKYTDITNGTVDQETAIKQLQEDDFQNVTVMGSKLAIAGKEIADSYNQAKESALSALKEVEQASKELIETKQQNLQNILGENVDLSNIKQVEEAYNNLNPALKEQVDTIQLAIAKENSRINTVQKLESKYLDVNTAAGKIQQAINDNDRVLTGISSVQNTTNELKDLAAAWKTVNEGGLTQLDIVNMLANNTDLLYALEVENGQLKINKDMIGQLADAHIDASIETIDAEIAKLEAEAAALDANAEYTDAQLENLALIAEQWANLSTDEQQAFINSEQAMNANIRSTDQWLQYLGKDVNSGIRLWNEYWKSVADQNGVEVQTSGSGGVVSTQNILQNTRKTSGAERLKNIQDQIEKLKALKATMQGYKGNYGKLFNDVNNLVDAGGTKDKGDGGGGSGDEYEPKIERLDKYYNYLRRIEKLEGEITRLRTRRSILDTTENYYIKSLEKENSLLTQQMNLNSKYLDEQRTYLASLRAQISGGYSDWVTFGEDGMIQAKQTDFFINNEEEENRYSDFSQLIEEYESKYQTYIETQNGLLETQQQIIENIKEAYEKVAQQIQDVTDRLEFLNSISEHQVDMSIGNLDKLTAYNKELNTTMDLYTYAASTLKGIENEMAQITSQANNRSLGGYLNWNANTNQYQTSDAFNEGVMNGSIGASTVVAVESLVAASQALSDQWQSVKEKVMDVESSLKTIVEDRLSAIEDLLGSWKDEITDIVDIINRELDIKDTLFDLTGYDTGDLESKYKLLANAAVMTRTSWIEMQKLTENALKNITKDYGEFVQIIDGTPFISETAIQESTTLTDLQKQQAKELIATYNQLKEATDELEDSTYEYLDALKELQENQLSQTIDILERIHEELRKIDEEELQDLQDKYSKMNSLDDEYYSNLSRRISDARNERNQLQNQQTLTQKQQQLGALQRDSSGAYNSQIVALQQEINQLMQGNADTNVDNELERIKREQEERQKDREIQIQQLENLITFKDENDLYWKEANEMLAEGYQEVSGFLANREQNNDQSELATQEAIAQTNQQLADVYADLGSYSAQDLQTSADIKAMFNNFLNGSENNSVTGLLNKLGLVDSDITSSLTNNIASVSNIINNGFARSLTTIQNGYTQFWSQFDRMRSNIDSNSSGIVNALNSFSNQASRDAGVLSNLGQQVRDYTYYTDLHTSEAAKNAGSASNNAADAARNAGSAAGGAGRAAGAAENISNHQGYQESLTNLQNNYLQAIYNKLNRGWSTYSESSSFGANILGQVFRVSLNPRRGSIYKAGGYADYTGPAWVDGTKSKPEAFLNAKQTALFEDLRDSLTNRSKTKVNKDEESKGDTIQIDNFAIQVQELADTDTVEKITKKVKNSIYTDATGKNTMQIRRR